MSIDKSKSYNIILAGVGGQGVLSVAAIITQGAMEDGLTVRQSEVHGMAQRGGAVLAHLRISDKEIEGDLIPRGTADVILSMEPLESLRYTDYLSPDGIVITSSDTFRNIPDYPDAEEIYAKIRELPRHRLIDSQKLAKDAGSARAVNMVMVGAFSAEVPLNVQHLEQAITNKFSSKGEKIVDINKKAFNSGRNC